MSRSKVTPEQRIEAALSYLNGEGSYKFIADRYGVEHVLKFGSGNIRQMDH